MAEKQAGVEREKTSLSTIFGTFAASTSLPAIGRVKTSRSCLGKTIWTLIIAATLIGTSIHLHTLISHFLKDELQTQIELKYSALYLPAITLCNTNPVRRNYLPDIGNLKLFEDGNGHIGRLDKNTMEDMEYIYNADRELIDTSTIWQAAFKKDFMKLNSTERGRISHQLDDMMLSCSIGEKICSAQNFTRTQTLEYGNCYTFETDEAITKNGPEGGLVVRIFLEPMEFLDLIATGCGFRGVIHEPGSRSNPHQDGFFLPGYTETNVALRLVEIDRLNTQNSPCRIDERNADGVTYTKQKTADTCGCYYTAPEDISNGDGLSQCKGSTGLSCWHNTLNDLYINNDCNCLNPCTEKVYQKTFSSKIWPTNAHKKSLDLKVCHETNCQNMSMFVKDIESVHYLKINIYFENLNYELVKEVEAYQPVEFFSDMGGTLGLWIGLSILSVFDIFELSADLFRFIVIKMKKSNKIAKEEK